MMFAPSFCPPPRKRKRYCSQACKIEIEPCKIRGARNQTHDGYSVAYSYWQDHCGTNTLAPTLTFPAITCVFTSLHKNQSNHNAIQTPRQQTTWLNTEKSSCEDSLQVSHYASRCHVVPSRSMRISRWTGPINVWMWRDWAVTNDTLIAALFPFWSDQIKTQHRGAARTEQDITCIGIGLKTALSSV